MLAPSNALAPIVSTLFGIVVQYTPELPAKANSPMLSTPSPTIGGFA